MLLYVEHAHHSVFVCFTKKSGNPTQNKTSSAA
jgi:hypothetical protein